MDFDLVVKSLKEVDNRRKVRISYLFVFVLFILFSFATDTNVKEDKEYDDVNHIVLYLSQYDTLPDNYIPKSESGSVVGEELYIYELFRNDEEKLPKDYSYTSLYIDAVKGDAGTNRLVYSDDAFFYTENHYDTFNEVKKSDILGFHYFIIVSTVIVGASVPIGYTVLIIKKAITFSELKEDLKGDGNKIKSFFNRLIQDFKNRGNNTDWKKG